MEEYKRRLKRQNVLLWIALVLVVVLDVLIGEFWEELGFLHSYQMTQRARNMQSMLLFGFLVYFVVKLVGNKRRLKNLWQYEEEARWQKDERRILIGEKAAKLAADLALAGLVWRRLLSACTTWTLSTPCITPCWALSCCGLGAGSMSAGNIDRPRRMCYNKQKYAAGAPGAAWKIASEKEWIHTW